MFYWAYTHHQFGDLGGLPWLFELRFQVFTRDPLTPESSSKMLTFAIEWHQW